MSNSTAIIILQPIIYHGFGMTIDSKEWFAIYNLHGNWKISTIETFVILNFVHSEVWAVQRHIYINVTFKVLSQ